MGVKETRASTKQKADENNATHKALNKRRQYLVNFRFLKIIVRLLRSFVVRTPRVPETLVLGFT